MQRLSPVLLLLLLLAVALASLVQTSSSHVVARNEFQSLSPAHMPHGSFTRFLQLSLPHEVASTRNVMGKIRLNNQLFNTRCRCTDADHESSCRTPSRLRIHREAYNPGVGPKRTELAELLGKPSEFVLMPVKGASFSDVDSRESNLVLAAPGGDAGQFLIALQEYERVLARELSFAQVEALFRSYVSQLDNQFYIATDEESLAHLQRNLHVDGGTGDVLTLDMNDPDDELKAELLKDLVKPRNQGSRFLRAVLEDPAAFMMRRALVKHFLRAVYRTLWDRSTAELQQLSNKIKLTVFDGRPKPALFMNMIGNAHCQQEHKAPAYSPRSRRGVGEVQLLLNHPLAVSTLLELIARHFVGVGGGELSITVGELHARFVRASSSALEVFAEKVCKKLAVFTVTVE